MHIGNFTISVSPAFGFGEGGLTSGVNMGFNYGNGDFNVGLNYGLSNSYSGFYATASYKEWGLGYGLTKYAASNCLGVNAGSQVTGTYGLLFPNGGFKITNDLFGDGQDRWRTSAAELSINNVSIGTYIVTNYGEGDGGGRILDQKAPWPVGKNRNGLGAWKNGTVFSAPLWIGIKSGEQTTRLGLSLPVIQNMTQNLVHTSPFGPQSYYLNYERMHKGLYSYYGYNSPVSLWNF